MTGAPSHYKSLRGWGLIAVAVLALLGAVEGLAGILDEPGVRGHFDMYFDGTGISHVVPGGAADRAGIRGGDRFDLDRLYPMRATFDPVIGYQLGPGTRVTVPLIRGTHRLTVTPTLGSAMAEPPYVTYPGDLDDFIAVLVLLLGAWTVVKRPTLMTWSLFAFLLSSTTSDDNVLFRLGYPVMLASAFIIAVFTSTQPFLIVFAARVPNDASSVWRRWFVGAGLALFAVILLVETYPIVAWSIVGLPAQYVFPPSWIGDVASDAALALAPIALAASYAVARGQDRERMGWIALGVIMLVVSQIPNQFVHGFLYLYWLRTIALLVNAAGFAAIAYGILKGSIVDVTFILSHAVVASVLAGGIITTFAVADWAVGKVLASARLGTITDIGLAIILGFSFSGLHRRVDRLVDRLFFRKRFNAEQRLKLAGRSVLQSASAGEVREFLIDEPCAALDLLSAALFEPGDTSRWRRTRAIGWAEGTLEELADDDPVVRRVSAARAPAQISNLESSTTLLPVGLGRPVLAVPVLARRRVVAIALYGQHRSGADIDADEIAGIERVADAAGAAFDHVEAENLRHANEELARKLDALTRRPSAT